MKVITWASTARIAIDDGSDDAHPTGYTHEGVIWLFVALCELSGREADKGNQEAKAWLADVASVRPRNLRFVSGEDPRPKPRRRRRRAA